MVDRIQNCVEIPVRPDTHTHRKTEKEKDKARCGGGGMHVRDFPGFLALALSIESGLPRHKVAVQPSACAQQHAHASATHQSRMSALPEASVSVPVADISVLQRIRSIPVNTLSEIIKVFS